MADGGPVIQGIPGWPANLTATPTQLVNGATAGDGIGLYLFAGSNGDGLYVVGRGGGRAGVRSYSYDGDGVHGVALGPSAAAGVRGASASAAGVLGEAFAPDAPGVQGIHQAGGSDGVGVYGSARTGVWGDGAIGVIGQSQREFGIGVEGDASADGGIGSSAPPPGAAAASASTPPRRLRARRRCRSTAGPCSAPAVSWWCRPAPPAQPRRGWSSAPPAWSSPRCRRTCPVSRSGRRSRTRRPGR